MFERLNQDRRKEGLPPLEYDERLADVGRAHSEDMRVHQFFSHESPTYGTLDDRLDRAGYVAKVARENLAEAPDVDTAEDGLLKSPHHHENIMAKDIAKMGIGIVRGGVKAPENLLFTQEFSAPARSVSASDVTLTVLARIRSGRSEKGLGPMAENPVLKKIANDRISDLSDDLGQSSLDSIAENAIKDLGASPSSGLTGLVVGAARVYDGDDYDVPAGVLDGKARGVGVAVRDAHDERGRPAKKVLVVIGQ